MDKQSLIPLKVKIKYGNVTKYNQRKGVETKPQHIYPDFNQISEIIRGNLDWSTYIDTYGSGWIYDKLSGIGEVDTENSDPTVWNGLLMVPKDFADEAVRLFPDTCSIEDEDEAERFYNERSAVTQPSEVSDQKELLRVQVLLQSGVPATDPRISKALDPDDPTVGVKRNTDKTWEGFKSKRGMTIDESKKKQPK